MIFINLCFWRPSCRLPKSSSSSSKEFFCQFWATILLLKKKKKWNEYLSMNRLINFIIIVIALLESTLPCKLTEVTSKFLNIFQNSCEILHKINNRNERESWYILSHGSFEDCNDISISTKTAFPFLQFQVIIWAVETLYFALFQLVASLAKNNSFFPFNQSKSKSDIPCLVGNP